MIDKRLTLVSLPSSNKNLTGRTDYTIIRSPGGRKKASASASARTTT